MKIKFLEAVLLGALFFPITTFAHTLTCKEQYGRTGYKFHAAIFNGGPDFGYYKFVCEYVGQDGPPSAYETKINPDAEYTLKGPWDSQRSPSACGVEDGGSAATCVVDVPSEDINTP